MRPQRSDQSVIRRAHGCSSTHRQKRQQQRSPPVQAGASQPTSVGVRKKFHCKVRPHTAKPGARTSRCSDRTRAGQGRRLGCEQRSCRPRAPGLRVVWRKYPTRDVGCLSEPWMSRFLRGSGRRKVPVSSISLSRDTRTLRPCGGVPDRHPLGSRVRGRSPLAGLAAPRAGGHRVSSPETSQPS
jgi:hypothetical protein